MSTNVISPQMLSLVRKAKRSMLVGQPHDVDELVRNEFGIDGPRRFGIGQQPRVGRGCQVASYPEIPGCEPDPTRYCDMQKVGDLVQANGSAAFTLTILPTKIPYFFPRAVRATVRDANNSDIPHKVFFTGVSINDFPQELFFEATPTAATTSGIWSDDWTAPDSYAVKVPWGVFSNTANQLVLRIHGFTRGLPAATLVDIQLSVYGQGMRSIPKWMDEDCCFHPNWNKPNQEALAAAA